MPFLGVGRLAGSVPSLFKKYLCSLLQFWFQTLQLVSGNCAITELGIVFLFDH